MRVGILADTHLRCTEVRRVADAVARMSGLGAEIAVLAGDVGEGSAAFRRCLAVVRSRFGGDVLVLCGNHDLWNAPGYNRPARGSRELWEEILPRAMADAGCIDLERSVWRRGGLAVAGSIGWYDYSATPDRPPNPWAYYEVNKFRQSNDADFIDWEFSDRQFAAEVGRGLVARLGRLELDPGTDAVLVATHMPLFERQLAGGYDHTYWGNLTLGGEVSRFAKVRWVVSGHTHAFARGAVPRAGGADMLVATVPSDYGRPGFVVVDTEASADAWFNT
jgi:hypothetical protein